MGFKKSNNINKLESSIEEKNKSLHTKEKEITNVIEKSTIYNDDAEKNSADSEFETIMISKLISLKHESKDNNKKKNEHISLRVSGDTYSKIKQLSSSGILSQSELVTILIENLYKEVKGGK